MQHNKLAVFHILSQNLTEVINTIYEAI